MIKKRRLVPIALVAFCLGGCATARDMTSPHYLPEWENKLITVPHPSETSGGHWAVKSAQMIASGTQKVLLFPMALVGNAALNAYYIPSWPVRRMLRGDKRLIVWNPLFKVGQEVHSDYYSKEWNRDLV